MSVRASRAHSDSCTAPGLIVRVRVGTVAQRQVWKWVCAWAQLHSLRVGPVRARGHSCTARQKIVRQVWKWMCAWAQLHGLRVGPARACGHSCTVLGLEVGVRVGTVAQLEGWACACVWAQLHSARSGSGCARGHSCTA